MKKIGTNEYECEAGEQIEIDFTALPSRKNVGISRAWNGEDPVEIKGNSITKKMDGEKMTLTIFFVFVSTGTCGIDISGENGIVDSTTAHSLLDQKDFIFRRAAN